jgi:poly [ADP-ribose] polymerase
MPPKRARKAAAAAKPALDGCVIALSGTFSGTTHGAIKARAEALGATVENAVTDKTTHLVASAADYGKPSTKVAKAKTLGLHIVSLEWLSLCEKNNTKEPEKDHVPGTSAVADNSQQNDASQTNGTSTAAVSNSGSRKRAPTAGSDDAADDEADAPKAKKTRGSKAAKTAAEVKKEDEDIEMKDASDAIEPEPEEDTTTKSKNNNISKSKKAKAGRAVGKRQVAKDKNIVIPLDEGCPYVRCKVYIDDSGIIYDASLNQTNVSHNNNKFYRIQVSNIRKPMRAEQTPDSLYSFCKIPMVNSGHGRAGAGSASEARRRSLIPGH